MALTRRYELLPQIRAALGDVRSDVSQIRAEFATGSGLSGLRRVEQHLNLPSLNPA